VQATYDLLLAVLEEVNARPRALIDAVAAAEAQTIARGRQADPAQREVVLTTRTGERADSLAFKGWVTRWEKSDISGAPVARYTAAPWDTVIPFYRDVLPGVVVREPAGYVLPQEWTAAIDRLDIHGVRYRRFTAPWRDTVEVQHVLEWSAATRSFEGHRPITVKRVALERRVREARPGDLWIPLDQRSAAVAVNLLEAQAPDGLMYWNVFDTVFEFKEYGEDYIVEPIARRMLHDDPSLAKDFQARLAADTSFAKSPQARIDYFYRRSPWADPYQDQHPALRALRPPPESVLGR
jgi:hypothetical protein